MTDSSIDHDRILHMQ